MELYEKAKDFAVRAHESIGQVRKFGGAPYYTHVLRVAELVRTKTDDQEILAAACLHDVLEDVAPINPDYSEEVLLAEFGPRVLKLVIELTNVYTKESFPHKNRKERKTLEVQRLAAVSEDAKLIKRADLHDNSQDMPQEADFGKVWFTEKARLDAILGVW